MAEIHRTINNADYVNTGKGIFKDIEVNLLAIVEKSLEDMPDQPTENDRYSNPIEVKRLAPSDYIDADPKSIDLCEYNFPMLFAYVVGDRGNATTMGELITEKSKNIYEEFYVCVEYIHGEVDTKEAIDETKEFGSFLRDILLKNHNLNDLINGPSEYIEGFFNPDVQVLNKQFCPVNSFKIKWVYRKTKTSQTSRRNKKY